MYFAVPILGLTVIIESIVELSSMLRDRRRFLVPASPTKLAISWEEDTTMSVGGRAPHSSSE